MDIINFKMVNGDELIAKMNSETSEHFVIDNPRALQFQDHGDGRVGAAFVPAIVLGKDTGIILYKSAISMYTNHINPEYEKHYLQSVSGIQLATTLKG